MNGLTKPQPAADRQLARLAREVDRTRAEYQAAQGEERDQCWRLYQRAIFNHNAALEKQIIATENGSRVRPALAIPDRPDAQQAPPIRRQ